MIPEFKDNKELIAHLRANKANKAELVAMKKKAIKLCDGVGGINLGGGISKAEKGASSEDGVLIKTIIGNTYNWMDSHGDVHVGNTFKKSIGENKNIFHLHDHEFKITAKVGDFTSVEERPISWRELGVNKEGSTTVLVGTSEIRRDYNSQIYNEYKANKINQHSVGMYYVKIDLAINSNESEDAKEKGNWDTYLPLLGNPERAEEKGYFWVVKEAKLSEISAVLLGSNELTGMYGKEKEPLDNTQEKDTQEEPSINYKYLIDNFKQL